MPSKFPIATTAPLRAPASTALCRTVKPDDDLAWTFMSGLPFQSPHDSLRKYAGSREHAVERRSVGIVAWPKFFRVNARGDEQAVYTECGGTLEVGADRIPNGQHARAVERLAAHLHRGGERLFVDGRVRLAGIEHLAARIPIAVRNGAGAIDEMFAALHHDIRIGAQHHEVALAHRCDQFVVVMRGFSRIVIETGTDDEIGAFDRNGHDIEVFEYPDIPLGADVEHALAGTLRDDGAGYVSGTHDTIIGFRRNRDAVEKPLHEFARAGRIGDQHDRTALPAEAGKRVAGLERCRHAIVDDPPDVAQYGVVVGGES